MASARLEVNVQFAKNLSRMQRGWSKPLLNASPTGHRICHALRRQHALQDVTPALWRVHAIAVDSQAAAPLLRAPC